LFDLGDFVDDYARDPFLRNDLGLLWFVTVDATGPRRVEAVPLKLEYCNTRLATGDDLRWISERFRAACGEMGTDVEAAENSLVIAAQREPEP
jgi:poly-gamma-glutamate synthesis protein (capsule biosynthesis protein)